MSVTWKPLVVGAGAAAAFVLIQSPRMAIAIVTPILLVALITRLAWSTMRRPAARGSMIAAGMVVGAAVVAFFVAGNDLMFVMAGLPGLSVAAILYVFTTALGLDGTAAIIAMAGMAFVYWVVNTAILGMLITGLRSLMAHRRAPHGTTVAAIACALALGVAGCLTDTPPKTPNQREAERNAPVVAVPPPDAGRTPRPASQ